MLSLVATIGVAASAATANVTWGHEPMRLSTTGPQSTLPSFFFMSGAEEGGSTFTGFGYTGGRGKASPFEPSTSCPLDVFDNTSPDLRVPQLPWRLQEDWGCEAIANRTKALVDVIVMETDQLRAAITPQWGGKVWSLYHKGFGRQLFFNNPAHQPGNIGYRKAWSSGGCEWNWAPGKIGHSVFTESPVWAAKLETELGPLVRVWEYDRQNGTVWQVDVLLVGDVMFAHPKVTNPTEGDLPGYWWTCVAMPVEATTRIVTPATLAIDGGGCSAWPNSAFTLSNASFRGPDLDHCASANSGRGSCAWQPDMSYLGNIPTSNDFFMHIEPDQEPFIAHVASDAFTVVHSHPKRLNGTKFFEWGYNECAHGCPKARARLPRSPRPPLRRAALHTTHAGAARGCRLRRFGTYNQDFLSASQTDVPGCNPDAYDPWCEHMVHEGAYTELQVGPARTQMHTFNLPAQSSYEWTEWFKATDDLPASKLHAADYSLAVASVGEWVRGAEGMDPALLAKADAILTKMADVPPTAEQILSKGLPWGAMQEMLLAKLSGKPRKPLAPGAPFPDTVERTVETAPWLELLESGAFSPTTLSRTPVTFEVSDGWVALLQASITAATPATWLHWLLLGTHALEAGNAAGARELLNRSMALKPNVLAQRNLATFAPTADAAAAGYRAAWALWEALDPASDPTAPQLGEDLASEIAGWLRGNGRWVELKAFLAKLRAGGARTAKHLKRDRVLHAIIALAVEESDYASALPLLRSHCFPTYGGERAELIQLWWKANLLKESDANGGRPLSVEATLKLRKRLRCDGDSTTGKLDGKCLCGPPNIGYAY